jgi:hypothetical protein
MERWRSIHLLLYPSLPPPIIGSGSVHGLERRFGPGIADEDLENFGVDWRHLVCILVWSLSPARTDRTQAIKFMSAFITKLVQSVPGHLQPEIRIPLVASLYGPRIEVQLLSSGSIDLRPFWQALRTWPETYELRHAWDQLRFEGIVRSGFEFCLLSDFVVVLLLVVSDVTHSRFTCLCNSICTWIGDFAHFCGECGWLHGERACHFAWDEAGGRGVGLVYNTAGDIYLLLLVTFCLATSHRR